MPLFHKISILLLYFSALVSLNVEYVSISLYIAIPISFLFSFYGTSVVSLFRNKYFKTLLFLYLWCAFTAITAIDISSSLRQFNQILGVILLFSTIINLSNRKKNIPWLYGLYILLFIAVMKYVKDNLLMVAFDVANSRIGDDKLNTNTVAYYTFFMTASFYVLSILPIRKIFNRIFSIAFILMIPASFWIAIYTASRQVLLIQIPLISLLIYLKYFYGNKKIIRYIIIGTFVLGIGGSLFMENISDAYENSYLKRRSERNVEKDPRIALMEEAIDVGIHNPVLGVGPGNFSIVQPQHMFSHCSFTELFANSGLPALILYSYMLLLFIKEQFKFFRRSKDKIFLVFTVLGIIYFFYNFFYVFYIDLWLMSFFALIVGHSFLLQKELTSKKEYAKHNLLTCFD